MVEMDDLLGLWVCGLLPSAQQIATLLAWPFALQAGTPHQVPCLEMYLFCTLWIKQKYNIDHVTSPKAMQEGKMCFILYILLTKQIVVKEAVAATSRL